MRKYTPISIKEDEKDRIYASVPLQLKEKFRELYPHSGALQWLFRLFLEQLVEVSADTAIREHFGREILSMYAQDAAHQKRQISTQFNEAYEQSVFDFPPPEQLTSTDNEEIEDARASTDAG